MLSGRRVPAIIHQWAFHAEKTRGSPNAYRLCSTVEFWAVREPYRRSNVVMYATRARRFRSSTILRACWHVSAARSGCGVGAPIHWSLHLAATLLWNRCGTSSSVVRAQPNAGTARRWMPENQPPGQRGEPTQPTFVDSALTQRGSWIFMSCSIALVIFGQSSFVTWQIPPLWRKLIPTHGKIIFQDLERSTKLFASSITVW